MLADPDIKTAESDEASLVSDAKPTNSATWRTLYKAREPIYPKAVKGTFRRLKWAVMALLLAVYYVVPFIRWDRGPNLPDQAVLVDLDRPRLFFFWLELWPQEIYFLAGLLIAAALGLFLFTALFGRVWCGFACPQTVWTDLYLTVERYFEGDRNQQIRLAREPWDARKITRKLAKHSVWLLIAFATGGAWVLYFYDAPSFYGDFFSGRAGMMAYAFVGGLTFTTYTLAGFMREQVCTFMCPWPRIQASMLDSESMQVSYLKQRGEPRAPHKKGTSWDGRGDCIDCNQCVAACPMGIDIRDGDQLECINCGLCIDACDEIMDKVGRPTGLIAFESLANIERRDCGQPGRWRLVRPRTAIYAGAILAVGLVMLIALIQRSPIDFNVLRERNPTFVRLSNGDVRNAYTLKIMNRSVAPMNVRVEQDGLATAWLKEGGAQPADDSATAIRVSVNPDEIRSVRLLITAPAGLSDESSLPVTLTVTDDPSGASASSKTVFMTGVGE